MSQTRLSKGDLLERVDVLIKEVIHVLKEYYDTCHPLDKVMCQQLMKSITSVGANLSEADVAISKKEFVRIVYISIREAHESRYWMKLITNEAKEQLFKDTMHEIVQVIKILQTIINKSK